MRYILLIIYLLITSPIVSGDSNITNDSVIIDHIDHGQYIYKNNTEINIKYDIVGTDIQVFLVITQNNITAMESMQRDTFYYHRMNITGYIRYYVKVDTGTSTIRENMTHQLWTDTESPPQLDKIDHQEVDSMQEDFQSNYLANVTLSYVINSTRSVGLDIWYGNSTDTMVSKKMVLNNTSDLSKYFVVSLELNYREIYFYVNSSQSYEINQSGQLNIHRLTNGFGLADHKLFIEDDNRDVLTTYDEIYVNITILNSIQNENYFINIENQTTQLELIETKLDGNISIYSSNLGRLQNELNKYRIYYVDLTYNYTRDLIHSELMVYDARPIAQFDKDVVYTSSKETQVEIVVRSDRDKYFDFKSINVYHENQTINVKATDYLVPITLTNEGINELVLNVTNTLNASTIDVMDVIYDITAPEISIETENRENGLVKVTYNAYDQFLLERIEIEFDSNVVIKISDSIVYNNTNVNDYITQILSSGEHMIELRVWDRSGNLASKTIEVIVTEVTSQQAVFYITPVIIALVLRRRVL